MFYIRFLAPSITRKLDRNDVFTIKSFSGRFVAGDTGCFVGKRPLYLAKLVRSGSAESSVVEFIPLKRKVKIGMKISRIVFLETCVLGEDFVDIYRGCIIGS